MAAVTRTALAALMAGFLPVWPLLPASADGALEVNLKAVGHSDLGGPGPWDDLVVVGATAAVSSAPAACGPSSVTLVDLKEPRHPAVVGTLPQPEGVAVTGLDGGAMSTPAFTGDLLAVALGRCRPGAGAGVAYYDVSQPAAPRLLSRTDKAGARSVSIAVREDGRVVAATVVAGDGDGPGEPVVDLDDVSDPARPVPLTQWTRPAGAARPCPVEGAYAELPVGGRRALVAFSDGAVYDLDLAEPARPVVLGSATGRPGQGRAGYATSLPVGRRTLAVVSERDGPGETCGAGTAGRGLRLLAVEPPAGLADAGEVRLPSPASPGRLAASGELAFVAWHTDGLRVVDLGQVVPRVVAQFAPPTGDVVGVAVLASYLVVTDRNSGFYVLDRPHEGQQESFWSKVKGAAGFIVFPILAALVLTVPRLAIRGAPAGSRSPVPTPVGVRSRPRDEGRPGGRPTEKR